MVWVSVLHPLDWCSPQPASHDEHRYCDEGRRSFRRSSTSSFSASSTAGLISPRTKSVTLMPG